MENKEAIKQTGTVALSEKKIKTNINYSQYLTFKVGNDKYGIPITSVKEVIEYDRVFRIPRVPDYIKGVTNLRGEVVPVIDLSAMFYGYNSSKTIDTGIIFIEIKYKENIALVGVIIDQVDSVTGIDQENIGAIPEYGVKINYDYISSIGKVDNEFVILLNIDKVLNIEEISSLNQPGEK